MKLNNITVRYVADDLHCVTFMRTAGILDCWSDGRIRINYSRFFVYIYYLQMTDIPGYALGKEYTYGTPIHVDLSFTLREWR